MCGADAAKTTPTYVIGMYICLTYVKTSGEGQDAMKPAGLCQYIDSDGQACCRVAHCGAAWPLLRSGWLRLKGDRYTTSPLRGSSSNNLSRHA